MTSVDIKPMKYLVPVEYIEKRIFIIRGHKVMLDTDLAKIYGVPTKRLNQQVHRNKGRFPIDFMFQLSRQETESLRLQNATLKNRGRGQHGKYLPYAFTEYGAVMVSAVLNTTVAIDASIQIARTFVKLRQMVATNKELSKRLDELERKFATHDGQIQAIFEAIRSLMELPEKRHRKIGFIANE